MSGPLLVIISLIGGIPPAIQKASLHSNKSAALYTLYDGNSKYIFVVIWACCSCFALITYIAIVRNVLSVLLPQRPRELQKGLRLKMND